MERLVVGTKVELFAGFNWGRRCRSPKQEKSHGWWDPPHGITIAVLNRGSLKLGVHGPLQVERRLESSAGERDNQSNAGQEYDSSTPAHEAPICPPLKSEQRH
jgi:hypothetical protein